MTIIIEVAKPSFLSLTDVTVKQAAESITKVAAVLSQAQLEQYCIPLLQRLSRGEWFTSRISACALYGPVYDKVSPPIQDELRRGFTSLGSDDTPMVRRAAARWLGVSLWFVPCKNFADLGLGFRQKTIETTRSQ